MSLATREDLAEEAGQPVVLPGLYRYGRLVVPPPMRGTREILVHQNLIADEEGLSRIQDDDDLRRMRAERMLVDFPESTSLHVNAELAGDRRCARPWTVRFAADIARAYYARFHQPLQLNSAVRTVAYQLRLRRVNGNAAGIGGDMASPHLTGEALDFGKHDMNTEEIAWMRTYLRPLMQVGKVDVEEEFQQACFHISVYRSYAPDDAVARAASTQSFSGPHVTRARTDVRSVRKFCSPEYWDRGRPRTMRSPYFITCSGSGGTFSPFLRASDRPMAIACFGLVTFLPLRPLFSLP